MNKKTLFFTLLVIELSVGFPLLATNSFFSCSKIRNHIDAGHYAFIDACTKDHCTKGLENEMARELKDEEFLFQNCTGIYQGQRTDSSFFVIPDIGQDLQGFRQKIFEIGVRFSQESIILATPEEAQLIYSTGPHKGFGFVGIGFKSGKENYSIIPCVEDNQASFVHVGEYDLNWSEKLDFRSEFN